MSRIPWNEQEAILLVDTYIKVSEGLVPRKTAVYQLSELLRMYGEANGVAVDEVYRNENGISMRLAEIERLFHDGIGVLKNTSRLFADTVNLYKNDKGQFDKKLLEAKMLTAYMRVKQLIFHHWLQEQSELKMDPESVIGYLNTGSEYAVEHKLCEKSFWVMDDPDEFENAYKRLKEYYLFGFLHRPTIRSLEKCHIYYRDFLLQKKNTSSASLAKQVTSAENGEKAVEQPASKANIANSKETVAKPEITKTEVVEPEIKDPEETHPVISKPGTLVDANSLADKLYLLLKSICETNSYGTTATFLAESLKAKESSVKNILANAEWAKFEFGRYIFDNSADQEEMVYNFEKPQSLACTKPVSLLYFEDTAIYADSWRQLWWDFLKMLYEDYPTVLSEMKGRVYPGAKTPVIADKNDVEVMQRPKKFAEGLYVETAYSAGSITAKLKLILDACKVDYENVVIKFKRKENVDKETLVKEPSSKNVNEAVQMPTGTQTPTDVDLAVKYPMLFKKTYSVLKRHNRPVSLSEIQQEIGAYYRETDIFTILTQASWAEKCHDDKFRYTDEQNAPVKSADAETNGGTLASPEKAASIDDTETHKDIKLEEEPKPEKDSNVITIAEAAAIAMANAVKPWTIQEIYNEIVKKKLYTFGARNPLNVVEIKVNMACRDSGYSTKAPQELFGFIREDGIRKFYLLAREESILQSKGEDEQKSVTAPEDMQMERAEVSAEEVTAVKPQGATDFSVPKETIAKEHKSGKHVDFNDLPDASFTKPTSVIYFERDLGPVDSWTDAYVKIVTALHEDYAIWIPVNRSFTKNGRPDFCEEKMKGTMIAPRQIADYYYLETNLSAAGILEKIKALLDMCYVEYENIDIAYESKSPSIASVPDVRNKPSENGPSSSTEEEAFYNYLSSVAHLAERTSHGYVSNIRGMERYAEEHHYTQTKLYGQPLEAVRAFYKELLRDQEFLAYNERQHNRPRAAIQKLIESKGGEASAVMFPTDETIELSVSESDGYPDFEKVLEEYFVKGFRLGSALDKKKFKRYYEELSGKELTKTDFEIENILRSCGIVHEEKLFLPKTMLSDEIKDKLFRYIEEAFADGKTALYYEALFATFSEDFLDYYIYDAEMLQAYLTHVNIGKYHIGKNQITKEAGMVSAPIDEIRVCLKEHGGPMETDKICEILSHLPKDTVYSVLGGNQEFVRNSRGEYFHADVIALSEEELDNIVNLIEDAITTHKYISGTELVKAIQAKYPYTYDTYAMFSVIGWRDALKYKIGDRFSFRGNIISPYGSTLMTADVFGELAAGAEQLTMDEIISFADEIGTAIYFEPIYNNALRVREDLFVSKKQAKFQIKETDAILDRFVTGSYLPLKEVSSFGIFPDAGFPWNIYLLESYVSFYSERFALLHVGYNQNYAVGAIVRRTAGYKNYDDLVTDILADSKIELNKDNALDYMVKNGYLARRSYANIESIVIQANAKRQKERRP